MTHTYTYTLLLCPFCGSNASVHEDAHYDLFYVSCEVCGFEGVRFDSLEEAVEWWNRRIPPVERLEKLRGEVIITMRHARTFITSKEKMAPPGVELWDKLFADLGGVE